MKTSGGSSPVADRHRGPANSIPLRGLFAQVNLKEPSMFTQRYIDLSLKTP